MKRIIVLGLAFAVLVAQVFSVFGCSESTGPRDEEQTAISVVPASGPPGTVLIVRGVSTSGLNQDKLEIKIAGVDAPAVIDPNGHIVTAIPLFIGAQGIPAPPIGPADLSIHYSGNQLAAAAEAVMIDPFPQAPGTLGKTIEEAESIAATAGNIAADIVAEPGEGQQYHYALFAAIDSLFGGEGEYSLGSLLEGQTEDSASVALLNGLLATNGVLNRLETMSDMLEDIYAQIPPPGQAEGGSKYGAGTGAAVEPFVVDDDLLALMMQIYVVVGIFGEEVIAETGAEFANTVGVIMGAIGLSGGLQGPNRMVAITQLILAYLDFLVNKVAVGFLPAHLDSVNLDLAEYELLQGDKTDASIRVQASNEPPTITLNYMVGNILTILGIGESSAVLNPTRQLLEEIAAYILGLMQGAFSSYADAHPELGLDFELGTVVPDLVWRAEVDDYRLMECLSQNHDLLTPTEYELNWESSMTNEGTTKIWVTPSIDEDAHVLPAVLPISYVGGAFGSDLLPSEKWDVEVIGRLALELDFPQQIDPGGAGVLGIRAGYRQEDGTVEYTSGIDLAIVVTGGTPEQSIGTTDDTGHFSTVIWADMPGAAQIDVRVMASGEEGTYQEGEISAQIGDCPGGVVSLAINCPSSYVRCKGVPLIIQACASTGASYPYSWYYVNVCECYQGECYIGEENSFRGVFDEGGCTTVTPSILCQGYLIDQLKVIAYAVFSDAPYPGGECMIWAIDSSFVTVTRE